MRHTLITICNGNTCRDLSFYYQLLLALEAPNGKENPKNPFTLFELFPKYI